MGVLNISIFLSLVFIKFVGVCVLFGMSFMKLYWGFWVMWVEEWVNFGWGLGGIMVMWSEVY